MKNNGPVRIAVSGAAGRMGSLILEEAARQPSLFQVAAALEQPGHPGLGKPLAAEPPPAGTGHCVRVESDVPAALARADLLIEFTTPDASLSHAEAAAAARVPMIIGTTGFTPEQMERLQAHARRIPIFWSPNMSLGIVVVRRAIGSISGLLFNFGLNEKTKVQISETHHTRKKDSPSGTAKALRDELLKQTGWLIRDEEIEARREGEVIGIHSVTFDCGSERITLTHEATDRRVFAQGALVIARHFRALWTQPGWHGMDDFVGAMQNLKSATRG
ncbi:MAG: 4-hydroxy-tetrahydrodipicolinate reductase [Candidatus Omnitrophica bacterium]|nr:4-hydroxy-tetrahydrodipicolinate reductase [Candidatus Omnitrophota bacterium]